MGPKIKVRRDLSTAVDEIVLDDLGFINGDYCAGLVDGPDFIDLLTDDRYNMDEDGYDAYDEYEDEDEDYSYDF